MRTARFPRARRGSAGVARTAARRGRYPPGAMSSAPASPPPPEGPAPRAESTDPRAESGALARALASHVARRAALGETRVARASEPKPAVFPEKWRPQSTSPPKAELVPAAPPALFETPEPPGAAANRALAAGCASLGELRAAVAGCTACPLARTRTQTVFSDGRDHARVLFVGEAPGQSEDEQGVPFVGAAGQLLTDIIQKGMGLARSEVYIANVLKCRPPGNRDPEPEEKALCTPFLDRQIELVDPEVIIALGLHAARHLLLSPLSMGRLRGKVHAWRGRKVIATYHPAFLLRTPSAKKDCWQDIQLAMRELGMSPPPSGPRPAAR
jgi:uracil-DNA glycosylase